MEKTTHGWFIRNQKRIFQYLLFLFAIATIVYLFPGEGKFRYHFQEGKPWKYGLLTAPFDFPIYKDEAQINRERDSILSTFRPYFRVDAQEGETMLSVFDSDYRSSLYREMTPALYNRIYDQLSTIYHSGILSIDDYSSLATEADPSLMILEKNIAKRTPLSRVLTTKSAYEQLIASIPNEHERSLIQRLKLNRYLTENLVSDSTLNRRIKEELLQKIAISSGLVQAGERIVDKGEVVSPRTYLILNSLEQVMQRKEVNQKQQSNSLAGEIIVVTLLYGCLFLFLFFFRRKTFEHIPSLLFLLLMVTGMTAAAYLISSFRVLAIYLIPFAMLPIIVCSLLDTRTALFSSMIAILLSAFVAPFAHEFIFLQLAVTITAMFSLHDLTKRSQLVRCAVLIFCVYCISYVGYALLTEGDWEKINATMFLYLGISSVLLLFAYLLIYLLEKTFGFISNVTLVELSDINTPILRDLSEQCPGTFQHALQVSNLAAEAAIKIGANSLLVRTGALYHDIGKLNNPGFFTENQSPEHPQLQQLSLPESARIIIQHVPDGIKTAERLMLPKPIIRFIATHHGKGKTKFFYNSYCNAHPGEKIDATPFQYPGPNPSTREEAILMMADSVEAASRSLKSYSEESITKLVDSLVDALVQEGLLNETPISFRDIEIIKESFIEKLKTIYHTRISYPELEQKEADPAEKTPEAASAEPF